MPVLARVYLVPPFEQHRLTRREFRAFQADYAQTMQQDA